MNFFQPMYTIFLNLLDQGPVCVIQSVTASSWFTKVVGASRVRARTRSNQYMCKLVEQQNSVSLSLKWIHWFAWPIICFVVHVIKLFTFNVIIDMLWLKYAFLFFVFCFFLLPFVFCVLFYPISYRLFEHTLEFYFDLPILCS